MKNSLKGLSLISFNQCNPQLIFKIFKTTDKIRKTNPIKALNILKGKIITLLFFEPSSRTFSSFAVAAKKLGAQTIEYQNPAQTSSTVKGESLEDTIKVFSAYSDLIIMRHPENGAAIKAQKATKVPIINAGDGSGEHPTQALLDLYTIYKKLGRLNNLTAVISGDPLHSRTIHSLLKALSLFSSNTVYLLSPKKLQIDKQMFKDLRNKKLKIFEITDENMIPDKSDIWYWNRIQKERFASSQEYKNLMKKFIITAKLLLKKANKNTIIMDPLPRIEEIDPVVDADPRAIYLTDQIKNGLYIRMALLQLILR